jgi:hypothetical protein
MFFCLTQWGIVAIVRLNFNSDLMQLVTDFEVDIFIVVEVSRLFPLAEQILNEIRFSMV